MKRLLILFFPIIAFGQSKITVTVPTGAGTVNSATSPLVVSGSNMTLNQITNRDSLPNPSQTEVTYFNLGSTISATTYDINEYSNITTLTNGTMFFFVITPHKTFLCSGVAVWVSTASNAIETASSYCGFNLFTISGSNIVFQDSTTRDTALFDVSTQVKTKNWANGSKLLIGGTTYVVSVVWNRVSQVTAPAIIGMSTYNGEPSKLNFPNNIKLSSVKTQSTPLTGTTSWSSLTTGQANCWIGLY